MQLIKKWHLELECKLFKDAIHMQISSSLTTIDCRCRGTTYVETQISINNKKYFFYSFTIFKITSLSNSEKKLFSIIILEANYLKIIIFIDFLNYYN